MPPAKKAPAKKAAPAKRSAKKSTGRQNELVEITHPETKATTRVPRMAAEGVWKRKGWKIDDQPDGDSSSED